MNLSTTNIASYIDQLVQEYRRYRRHCGNKIKEDFVFTTFFEKLIKVLGWDPWFKDDYLPFNIDRGHSFYYGAKLFLPNRDSILAVFLDDNNLFSPDQIKEKNLDMSFQMREVILTVQNKLQAQPQNTRYVWFSSILKNCIYDCQNEVMLSFFGAKGEDYEKIHRSFFLKHFNPNFIFTDKSQFGFKLAVWLRKWEEKLDSLKNPLHAQELLDFLVAVNILIRSELPKKPEKNIFESLLGNYHLNQRNEFMLEVDFSRIIPKMCLSFKDQYNFNFFSDMQYLCFAENDLLVRIVEELSCFSKMVFSLDSLGMAYYIIEKEALNNAPKSRYINVDWFSNKPIMTKYIDLKPRPLNEMEKLVIRVDGDDLGLVLGTYDTLEEIYLEINRDNLRSAKKDGYLDASDLFGIYDKTFSNDDVVVNIPSKIIERNLKIVNTCLPKKRTLNILLIRKIVTSMEKSKLSNIKFPNKINFVS